MRVGNRLTVEALESRSNPSMFFAANAYSDLAPMPPMFSGDGSSDTATADFNQDGHIDICSIRRSGSIIVYLNNGSGAFSAVSLMESGFTNGPYGTTLAAGDFNADGKPDIAAFGLGGGDSTMRLRVFLGNGDGHFLGGTVIPGVSGAFTLKACNLNGDAAADLIADFGNGLTSNRFTVMLGQPGGTLSSPTEYSVPGQYVRNFTVADFNNDGKLDVAALAHPSGNAYVFSGVGDGSLHNPTAVPLLNSTQVQSNGSFVGFGEVVSGDFTGDGNQDMLAVGFASDVARSLILVTGNGDGTFSSPSTVNDGFPATGSQLDVGEFDGDGHLDVVTQAPSLVLLGDGLGAFLPSPQRVDQVGAPQLAIADFNSDGRSDLTYASDFTGLEAGGSGMGIRVVETRPAVPGGSSSLPTLLVVKASGPGSVQGYSTDPFEKYRQVSAMYQPGILGGGEERSAAGDLDGDGEPDIVVVTGPGTPLRVTALSGLDHLTVLIPPFDPFGGDFSGGGFVAAADFDNDGHAEFVVSPDEGGGPRVTIFSLVGETPTVRANFFGIDDPSFRGGARPAVGDVNHDDVPDMLIAAGFGGGPPRRPLRRERSVRRSHQIGERFLRVPGRRADAPQRRLRRPWRCERRWVRRPRVRRWT